jgi:hypothetical protein
VFPESGHENNDLDDLVPEMDFLKKSIPCDVAINRTIVVSSEWRESRGACLSGKADLRLEGKAEWGGSCEA